MLFRSSTWSDHNREWTAVRSSSRRNGARPSAQDRVKVDYIGTFEDGTEFDSSYKRSQAVVFPLKNLIKGWIEGLQLMKVGSIYRFVIPPELAYGDKAQAQIPANSTLVFEVELLEIEKTKSK